MIREFGLNEVFYITFAIRYTILLSLIAFAGGAVGGLIIALMRVSENRYRRWVAIAFIRVFQGTPLLMQLFLAYFGLAIMGFKIDPWTAASLALILHAAAFLGEIWRGCIESVPTGQHEAARVVGLGYYSRMRYVVLPQASRIAVAPTTGFLVQLIKATSLASIIGFTELTRAGQIISNATFQPFMVISLVAVLYFILCWPLSRLASNMEHKFNQATTR
ncbi:MAG: amino acid ABC transporter permease [Sulfitobacter sp.]